MGVRWIRCADAGRGENVAFDLRELFFFLFLCVFNLFLVLDHGVDVIWQPWFPASIQIDDNNNNKHENLLLRWAFVVVVLFLPEFMFIICYLFQCVAICLDTCWLYFLLVSKWPINLTLWHRRINLIACHPWVIINYQSLIYQLKLHFIYVVNPTHFYFKHLFRCGNARGVSLN